MTRKQILFWNLQKKNTAPPILWFIPAWPKELEDNKCVQFWATKFVFIFMMATENWYINPAQFIEKTIFYPVFWQVDFCHNCVPICSLSISAFSILCQWSFCPSLCQYFTPLMLQPFKYFKNNFKIHLNKFSRANFPMMLLNSDLAITSSHFNISYINTLLISTPVAIFKFWLVLYLLYRTIQEVGLFIILIFKNLFIEYSFIFIFLNFS